MVSEQKAEEKITEQHGGVPPVSEQKAEEMITEQPDGVPAVSEQKAEKITEQPDGVPSKVSEQNAEEKIAEQPKHAGGNDQIVTADQDAPAKSKHTAASGAVRFAVENPQLLHRFDFKEGVMALKPGETEHDRDCRLAHNLYVRYNKSVKGPNCPPEVAEKVANARRGSRTIETMFADWVSSRGDLIKKEGQEEAMDWDLLRVWDSAAIEKVDKHKVASGTNSEMPEMVRGLLAAASASSGSAAAAPAPTAGGAPMMALPCPTPLPGQEELGASLGSTQLPIVKKPKALVNKCENKIKTGNEKIADMDVLMEEMKEYEQMPAAVKDAYTVELKAHVEGLELKIKTLQHELDEGDGSKLQDHLDELGQGISDYMQASGGYLLARSHVGRIDELGPMARHVLQCTGKGDLSFAAAREMLQRSHEELSMHGQKLGVQAVIPHVLAHRHLDLQQLTTETAAYWSHMREHSEWGRDHPGSNRHHPLFLYGDDAQFSQQEKLTVVYCGFCLDARKNSMCVHLPLFIIRCSLSAGFETLQAFLKPVVASLNYLFYGFHPRFPIIDRQGNCGSFGPVDRSDLSEEPLMDATDGLPLVAAVTEIRGDWKFYKVS
ncbi:Kcnh2 [Symbiodinium sp. CCMP2592]|nr:Kcnh2 [Symbiodinium sp. CCMP2592]